MGTNNNNTTTQGVDSKVIGDLLTELMEHSGTGGFSKEQKRELVKSHCEGKGKQQQYSSSTFDIHNDDTAGTWYNNKSSLGNKGNYGTYNNHQSSSGKFSYQDRDHGSSSISGAYSLSYNSAEGTAAHNYDGPLARVNNINNESSSSPHELITKNSYIQQRGSGYSSYDYDYVSGSPDMYENHINNYNDIKGTKGGRYSNKNSEYGPSTIELYDEQGVRSYQHQYSEYDGKSFSNKGGGKGRDKGFHSYDRGSGKKGTFQKVDKFSTGGKYQSY